MYQRARFQKRRKWLFFSFVFIVLGLFVFLRFVFPDLGRSSAHTIGFPFWKGVQYIEQPFQTVRSYFLSKSELSRHNDELREENARLLGMALLYDVLSQENARLATSLDRSGDQWLVPGEVLVHPPQIPFDTLILDVGESSGLSEGDVVSSYSFFEIGTVEKVGNQTSRVSLYSQAGRETSGQHVRLGFDVTLLGRGGGNFEIKLPQDVVIEPGDRIVSSGAWPQLIAVVEKVDARPSDSFQTILAQYPINLAQLQWVEVTRSSHQIDEELLIVSEQQ